VKNKKLLVLDLILIVAEVALILNMFYPAMSASQNRPPKKPVPSHGSVKGINVGLYVDQACTTPVESIQWGLIEPGATANQTVYIRNEGDSNTTLTMTLSNWNPTNSSNYIGLNWDYTGQTLDISQVIQVRFTLFILENIQGITDFSFDVTIASS
jgi:hypothetical protein